MKRIMVDMSATLIHHGHIRLIEKASQHGKVIVGLTTDEDIELCKGYVPEISYEHRKEILCSLKLVKEVVPTPWLLTEKVLDQYAIDLLVHGDDNSNQISSDRLLILPRTKGISSSDLRCRALESLTSIRNKKLMLTPGPAAVLPQSLSDIQPVFGRGDQAYQDIAEAVLDWIKRLSGQDEIVTMQGSATFALELAAHTFVSGKVLLISTGYYSNRLESLLPDDCTVTKCHYEELTDVQGSYDWVLCAYTETSCAFKVDLQQVRKKADEVGALLYADSTGSIGLEEEHELCDLTAFSSCKGLFGLTGACFIAHKSKLTPRKTPNFYFNFNTHKEKKVTGPYHAITSLYGIMPNHKLFRERVVDSKAKVMEQFARYIDRKTNQPLLCTYLDARVLPNDDNIVLYTPRIDLSGSVICHLGEIHHGKVQVTDRITVKDIKTN